MAIEKTTATAAADLFEELAQQARCIVALFHTLVDEPEDADCICLAGAALGRQLGYTAENAAKALGAGPCTQGDREWMLSPRGQASLEALDALGLAAQQGATP